MGNSSLNTTEANQMCHALIAALDAIKGKNCRNFIINKLNDEAKL